jgi:hypothetical protein
MIDRSFMFEFALLGLSSINDIAMIFRHAGQNVDFGPY